MQVTRLAQSDAQYPAALRKAIGGDIQTLAVAGNTDLLVTKAVALFCSVKCPGDLILKTYDLARALRDGGITVTGGFHSPMEKECLTLLLRCTQPIIVCVALSLEGLRVPTTWRMAMDKGRLMMISPFDGRCRRVTRETAEKRNRCIMSMADDIIVTYAHAGGRLEQLCRDAVAAGKTLWTLDDPANVSLIQLGAKQLHAGHLPSVCSGNMPTQNAADIHQAEGPTPKESSQTPALSKLAMPPDRKSHNANGRPTRRA